MILHLHHSSLQDAVIQMFLSLAQTQISNIMESHNSDLLKCMLLMSCKVVVFPDNNLTCASDTFPNVFRENVAARSTLALLIYHSISLRLIALPVPKLLQTAPHPKLVTSNEIPITGLPFVILLLEKLFLLYHR